MLKKVSIIIIFIFCLTYTKVWAANDVTSLTLINADTDTDIKTLVNGETINLATLPTRNLNVRANTSPEVTSVRFGLDGNANHRTEGTAPFALFGDSSGNYSAWTPAVGTHTITATGSSSTGTGTTYSLTFSVVDQGASPSPVPSPTSQPTPPPVSGGTGTVKGELKKWHNITIDFQGPNTSETANPNPFLDYRLDVFFTHQATGEQIIVPGYYAADGNAHETSATSGNIWRVHFVPNKMGTWQYVASFRVGTNAAIDNSVGSVTSFHGASGNFYVDATDKTGLDLRGKGMLRYVGGHHLQFAETGEYFIKGGADSPENLLAYADFDNTTNNGGYLKTWSPHVQDWKTGDPTWKNGKGKGLIGAINYLASEGMNAFSFLTLSTPNGDDRNVFPYIGTTSAEATRMDVSKLAQWEIVFSHGEKMGMFLHFKTQETENDGFLDGGNLGTQRKLYYRELIARFGHHLALNWNLGEEYRNDPQLIKLFSDYIKVVDPYDHPVVLHTYPAEYSKYYTPMLGYPTFDGTSLQIADLSNAETVKWVTESKAAGRPWIVSLDESGNAGTGIQCDADANDSYYRTRRVQSLWGNLLGGGAGVEWYFGYNTCQTDLNLQDFRTRDKWWDYTRYAINFFKTHIPFYEMESDNSLITGFTGSAYVLKKEGQVYLVTLGSGGTGNLTLPSGNYNVKWYNPRTGELSNGSVTSLSGGGSRSLGNPPTETTMDWLVLVTNINYAGPSIPPSPTPAPIPGDANGDRLVDGKDYVRWLNNYQTTTTAGPTNGDFNNDGIVDGKDYVVWVNNYTN